MITNNLKHLLAMGLQSSATLFGALPVRDVNGITRYVHGGFPSFPYSRTEAFTLTATAAGVSFGIGDTTPTDNDYQLALPITSGISVTLSSKTVGCDAPGDPWIQFNFTVTNNGSDAITIREVGYKQLLKCATLPGGSDSVDTICLIDRTVLTYPLTLAGGDAGVLIYKLKTHPMPAKTVHGVDMASFTWASDAQFGAMLDAAADGDINLMTDAGWRVGDLRPIPIAAFNGDGAAFGAHTIDIVLSSFEQYNGASNVIQFDFAESLPIGVRMNSSNTTAGGYDASSMAAITIPALIQALPTYLSSRLVNFDLLCRTGGGDNTIKTVTGMKMALRSTAEVFGDNTGEGSQLSIYGTTAQRIKKLGRTGSANHWWLRTPTGSSYFARVDSGGTSNSAGASYAYGVSPFGCLGKQISA